MLDEVNRGIGGWANDEEMMVAVYLSDPSFSHISRVVTGLGLSWGKRREGWFNHPVCDEAVYVYVHASSAMTPRCRTLPAPAG